LNPDYVISGFSGLEHHESVLGPAEDGGYVLLGLRKPQPEIFVDMPWGTSQVLNETMVRLKGEVKSLSTLWDVDRGEDLIRLRDAAQDLHLGKDFSEYLAAIVGAIEC
jgi:glycosyltransferase A (GT-A) superfamily protein (DUF2064 family)